MHLMNLDLQKLLNSFSFPVIACEKKTKSIVCMNSEARLLVGTTAEEGVRLEDVLLCRYESDLRLFWQMLETTGTVRNFVLDAFNRQRESLNLTLSAQILPVDGEEREIAVINLSTGEGSASEMESGENNLLFKILYMTYHSMDTDQTINEILGILGAHLDVSRTYIFEALGDETISNTFEWCAAEVVSQMAFCREFPKNIFSWKEIQDGLYIAGNVEILPEKDRLVLEPQGIRAIAILPLFLDDTPIGFIGCDECRDFRVWNRRELALIQSAGAIISSLLSRKRALMKAESYQEIMRTVLDNTKAVIYVSDFRTHEILFANKYLKQTLVEKDLPLPRVEGTICWQSLQKNQQGPCPFCRKPLLMNGNGSFKESYTWEHKNTLSGRWYLVTDSAIQWVDGRYVHMESALDITDLKQKEEELQEKADELNWVASMDALTDINNRQMGGILLEGAYKRVLRSGKKSTLCFLDLDGLKMVNDTFGHREGDRMLISFVNIFKEVIRGADIFCRWGGDEFILLLEGCSALQAERMFIRRADEKIESFNRAAKTESGESKNYRLSFSYGLEEIDAQDTASLDQIIAAADRKMYENKVSKRFAL